MILAGVISHVMMNIYTYIRGQLHYSDTEVRQNLTLHSAAQYSLFTGRFINGYCIRNYILSNYSFLYRSQHQMVSSIIPNWKEYGEGEVKTFVRPRTRYVSHVSVCSFRFRGKRAYTYTHTHTHAYTHGRTKLCRITVAVIFFESFVRISTT